MWGWGWGECSVPRRGGVVAAEGASGLQAAGHASAVWMLHAKVGMQEGGQVSAVGTSARNIFPVRALGHVCVQEAAKSGEHACAVVRASIARAT